MAHAFDANTRQLIRLWADKAPECGSTEKPRLFKDVNGEEVALSRNTVYNKEWKFRYAFEQETGFPVVQGGPIPHNMDTPKPNGNPAKAKLMTIGDTLIDKSYLKMKEHLSKPSNWTWDPVDLPDDNF